MSEEFNFDQAIDESIKQIRTGEIVNGKVIGVKPDAIFVNVGYKSDGIISRAEYTNDPTLDLTTVVSEGDEIEAKVLKVNDGDGQVQLSYKRISEEKANERIKELFENKEVIKVKVDSITKGGLITDYEGTKIFVPASLVSDVFEKDLTKYKDEEIEIEITEFDPRKRRIIGNRRKLLEATRAERAKELLETLQKDDIVEGTVKSITQFGAFLDLGGIDGLLHISEMSWGRVESPKNIFKIGDKVRVYIKDIADGKIALSAKFPDENPWVLAKEKYAPETIVSGKVARLADFGAFIELEPGVDALLHVSQISKKHVKKPADVLKIGQVIDAKVVDFKEDEKKISLSRKDFEDDIVPEDYDGGKSNKASEKIEGAVNSVKEKVDTVEEKVYDALEDKVDDLKDVAFDAQAAVKEKVDDVKDAIKDKASDIVANAEAKVEVLAEEIKEKAEGTEENN